MKNQRRILKSKVILLVLVMFLACIFVLFLIRNLSSRELDDVYPGRYCSEDLINKSDVIFVVPMPNSISIANNRLWCKDMLQLNKTIGMHGVYHAPDNPGEFAINRNENYIQIGLEEFKKCFGFYPQLFKAPEYKLSKENALLIKRMNLSIISESHALFHKNYHCVDYEQKSYLVRINKIVDLF